MRGLVEVARPRRCRPDAQRLVGLPRRTSRRGRPRSARPPSRRPRPRQARWMRKAISPRLAMSTVSNIARAPQPKRNRAALLRLPGPSARAPAATVPARSARTSLNIFIASITHSSLAGRDSLARLHEGRLAGRGLQVDHAVAAAQGTRCSAGRRRVAVPGLSRSAVRRSGRASRGRLRTPSADSFTSRSVLPFSLYSSSARSDAARASMSDLDLFLLHARLGGSSLMADAFRERVTAWHER